MDYWESLTKIIQSAITTIALLVGGFWAYFKYLRGRIYKPRLELNVECREYFDEGDLVRMQVTVVLKNLGLSRVTIDKKSSALRIHRIRKLEHIDLMPEWAVESEWDRIGIFSVFDQHDWIEPSEIIRDQKMIECKSKDLAFMIDTIIMSKSQQWYSSCIAITRHKEE